MCIRDSDSGMRKQFTEKFAEIQREFDKSFKQLFGGGHGSLELVEDEEDVYKRQRYVRRIKRLQRP